MGEVCPYVKNIEKQEKFKKKMKRLNEKKKKLEIIKLKKDYFYTIKNQINKMK